MVREDSTGRTTRRRSPEAQERRARREAARIAGRRRLAVLGIGAALLSVVLVIAGVQATAEPNEPAEPDATSAPAADAPEPDADAPEPDAEPVPGMPAPTPADTPTRAAPPPADPPAAPPADARVTKTHWYDSHRVALWVYSPAMDTEIQVQLLLARDWYFKPTEKFPQLTMLDGLRAQDDQSGWIINTDIQRFYQDKNVNVILPIGGESSFYTDWKEPDKGKNYQWETFLIHELPPIVEGEWRSTDVRGIEGLSMGGTAAMMLAARHPGFYRFAGSFSGILQLTSYGMPQAIQFAQRDGGGYDSQKMFGPPSDPAWAEHDPYLLAEELRGTSIYVSSGNGMVGQHDDPSDIPMLATNYSGVGLEVLSRVTSQQFAAKLNQLGIPGQVVYRPSGTHTWPYWEFEMKQAWPQAAAALGLADDKVQCAVGGDFKKVFEDNRRSLVACLTPEYAVPGGRAQDFVGGRMFTGPKGPKIITGAIGGAYVAAGGSGGKLGLPTSSELRTRDGKGRFNDFERGRITWSPQGGTKVSD